MIGTWWDSRKTPTVKVSNEQLVQIKSIFVLTDEMVNEMRQHQLDSHIVASRSR